MSEYEIQKNAKPSFEETLGKCTDSDMKKLAEEFVEFLGENKMKPQWGAVNSYNVSCKGKRVCILKINENGFEIRANTQYGEEFNACFADTNERVKAVLLDSVVYCFGCGTCKPGLNTEMFGKKFSGLCYNPVIKLVNPDRELLELAKKLVLFRKKAAVEGKVPKVTYIAKSKR